jgi:WD40 repeat protein
MWPRWLVPRFSIRTLLLLVAAIAVGLWSYLYLPDILNNRQDRLSRAAIDPYELSIAGDGDPAKAPPELVAILGDSRLKHWWRPYQLSFLDKTRLFAHGQDGATRIWDVNTGRQLQSFPATTATANRGGDKLFLASTTVALQVEIWDTAPWKPAGSIVCEARLPIVRLATNADGTRLAVALAAKDEQPVVEVWDVSEKKLLQTIKVAASFPFVAFDDAGGRLVFVEERLVKVIDVESGLEVGSFDPATGRKEYGQVHVAQFDNEENVLFTGDGMGMVATWNYRTGEKLFEFPQGGGSGGITSLCFNGDKSYLTASQNKGARVFVRRKDDWRLIEDAAPDEANRARIAGMAGSVGLHAFGCHDHSIVLADFQGAMLLAGGKRSDVTCLAFDQQNKYLATAGRDGQIALWQARTWRSVRTWRADREQLYQLTFAPDGSLLSGSRRGIVIWDPDTGAEVRRLGPPSFFHKRFAISADGQLIACPLSLPAASYSLGLWKLADGTPFKTFANPSPASSSRGELVFDPASKFLLVAGGKGVMVWDLATGKQTADLGSKTIHDVSVALHADRQRVAIAPWYGPLQVWNLATKKQLLAVGVHGGNSLVSSIAIHPAGKWAASVAHNGTACLWDFDSGALIKSWQLGPPKGQLFQVAFSPDGRYLATVNGNGTAYILRMDWIAGQ